MNDPTPLVTIAVPTLNQGQYLNEALTSIFDQGLPVEVFVADGGSTDNTLDVIAAWESRLAGWRSKPDRGQAAAINECIALGTAPFVAWLNSDDYLLPGGLRHLVHAITRDPQAPAVYGLVYTVNKQRMRPVPVEPFDRRRLAIHCIIAQPGTLIRRVAWERVGGLREELHMALDYDLWWRLFSAFHPLLYVDVPVAVNRDHPHTKTNKHRALHYREAMAVVREHNGFLPMKWWLAQPYAVWYRTIAGWCHRNITGLSCIRPKL